MTESKPVRVRIAPSPTGDPHVGTAYIGLINYCFAKRHGGKFILRIEDTDQTRCTEASAQAIYASLKWLGLPYDEGPDVGGDCGPYVQSERVKLGIYQKYADQLIADGHAYYCFCTARDLESMRKRQLAAGEPMMYDRRHRGMELSEAKERIARGDPYVIRMKIPLEGEHVYKDRLRKQPVVKGWKEIDDQVLLKSDGWPTYHLAAVVDDHLMGITHVVRGEEWISSTPKHLLLFDWLGWERPAFAHMPLLRNVDKSKISKRKNPAARLTWFVQQGYLPEALLNFLGLLGYSVPGEQEVFDFARMSQTFDWARVNTVGPVFDLDKLAWLNGHYVRELAETDFAARVLPFLQREGLVADPATADELALLTALVPAVQTRVNLLSELAPLVSFLFVPEDAFEVDPAAAAKALGPASAPVLTAAADALEGVTEWTAEQVQAAVDGALLEGGLGLKRNKAYLPLRAAVCGRSVAPPLDASLALLGRARVLRRLRAAAALAGASDTGVR